MKMSQLASLILVALVVVTFPATAATIHVPGEEPSIQAGIDAASHGDTVLVACGTYYEHDIVMKSGVCLTSETGLADCVEVNAQGLGRVFYCAEVDNLASFVGLTITGGLTAEPYPDNRGAGMYCSSSSPALMHCTFTGNQASGLNSRGGGIYCSYSSPTLTGCTFSENAASNAGGGIHCSFSSPTLGDCTFLGNGATQGGGMSCASSSPALTGCTFSENDGSYGGGMYCGNSSATFMDCAFSGNSANYSGGAMHFHGSSSAATLMGCTFSGNQAFAYGGGVECYESSPTLAACTFSWNYAGSHGGALSCRDSSSPTLTDCAFLGNVAGSAGGGILCEYSSSPTLMGCTLAENHGSVSGGILCMHDSSPTLINSIIAFSEPGQAIYCVHGINTPTLTCCDIYGNAGGDWVGCIADQYGVNGNFSADPLFCLEDNPDEPFSLHEGSSCLPENSPCGELVGALGQGCGAVSAVEESSWGAIKAMFR